MMSEHEHVFTYERHGAYHWHGTYARHPWRSSPKLHCHYDVPIKLIERHKALKTSIGLDVGTGDGVLLYKVQKRGGVALGLEINPIALSLARRELNRRDKVSGILIQASAYSIPIEDHSLDYITAIEVIEHFDNVKLFLSEVKRVLRGDGVFVCTTPFRQQHKSKPENPLHVFEYEPDELRQELSLIFSAVQVYGICPSILDWLYVKGAKVPNPFSKLIRFAFRVYASIRNPYTYAIKENPKPGWRTLVALARP